MNHRRYVAVLAVLVAVSGAMTTAAAAGPPPQVDLIGPIPTTATSHPFNTSTVVLASHGYVEEEFFLRGRANIYDYDASGDVVVARRAAEVRPTAVRHPVLG